MKNRLYPFPKDIGKLKSFSLAVIYIMIHIKIWVTFGKLKSFSLAVIYVMIHVKIWVTFD
jgi:low affinity Fe/Cu permease